MIDSKDKNKKYSSSDECLEDLEKRLEQLRVKYIALDKEYIGYLEADMNRQAGLVNKRKHEVEKEINFLKSRIKSKKELKRIKEEEMYGISQKMKNDLKLYEMFLRNRGLIDEFEAFKEEQEEEQSL
ncbi:MAG: hypothetical protein E7310_05170 [Clostridiales bacterium]|nr:hypothetical protein [Clostridiales bacterium]